MQVEISHENLYTYDTDVFLEPHLIRLYPRLSPFVSIIEESIEIVPKPVLTSKNIDAEGSTVVQAWFEGKTKTFKVNTKFKLEVQPSNPFGFFVHPINIGFPFEYSEKSLEFYTQPTENPHPELMAKIGEIKDQSDNNVITFLLSFADYIYKNYNYTIREDGAPQKANETFAQKNGSCRDFSVLLIEAARTMGLAARFVSGYKLNNKEEQEFHLHAWVEVFIPGGGWRGIDPTMGLFTDNDYIPLCASHSPENTAPIFGFTRGESKNKEFEYKIDIKTSI